MRNFFYDLPQAINFEYNKFVESMTVKKLKGLFKIVTMKGSEWVNEEARIVKKSLGEIFKV